MEAHKFWKTQPIIETKKVSEEIGPIEIVDIDKVRKEPYELLAGFEWSIINIDNENDISELCNFLNDNYLEDKSGTTKFAYSKETLRWILKCPDYFPELFICIRLSSDKKIVATICGIPMHVKVLDKIMKQVEINLLCINKTLRNNRLAPILIQEVTRRTNLRNIFQAVYTAGLDLPNKLVSIQYFHRFVNIKKLHELNYIGNKLSLSSKERLYKIDDNKLNLRQIEDKDIDICCEKLNKKLNNYNLTHIFDRYSFKHYFLTRKDIIYTYVKEKDNQITDMISFFIIDKIILNNPKHNSLKTAYLFHYFNETEKLEDIINSCLFKAKLEKVDMFNTLNMFDLDSVIKTCKFVEGTGFLNYYLFNYKCGKLQSNEVGLPMF
jgi:glycylpeptide N-tetradecanoyltransferase